MPGWRLGWTVIPDSLKETFKVITKPFYLIWKYSTIFRTQDFECINELNETVKKY